MTTFKVTFQYTDGYQQSISLTADSAEIAEQQIAIKYQDVVILKTETTNFDHTKLAFA